MAVLHVLILAIVQGITEFLPVSSSGHLVLTWAAFDWAGWQTPEETEAQRLAVDVAVHVGTLFAVLIYFWRDLGLLAVGLADLVRRRGGPRARLVLALIVGTLPLVAAGFLMKDAIVAYLRNHEVIAWSTIVFGLLLYVADRRGALRLRTEQLGLGQAVVIGLAQTLALIPGTSRSGITMTAARFLGFERQEAARISLLLAIPAILGAGLLTGLDLYRMGDAAVSTDAFVAAGLAFVMALVAIAAMMAWLRRASFTPFVVYRLLLGAGLLAVIYLT